MRTVNLTRGKVALVDDEDYEIVSQLKWHAFWANTRWYAKASPKKSEYIYMHRFIMNLEAGDPLQVDHINNDGLDNRRTNLRYATRSQQNMNRVRPKNTSSQFRGVCRYRNSKWMARIKLHGETIFLGYFDDEVAAAKEYDKAAKEHHGSFARLNFP